MKMNKVLVLLRVLLTRMGVPQLCRMQLLSKQLRAMVREELGNRPLPACLPFEVADTVCVCAKWEVMRDREEQLQLQAARKLLTVHSPVSDMDSCAASGRWAVLSDRLQVYDELREREVSCLEEFAGHAMCCALQPGAALAAVGFYQAAGESLQVYHLESGERLCCFPGINYVSATHFLPLSPELLAYSCGGTPFGLPVQAVHLERPHMAGRRWDLGEEFARDLACCNTGSILASAWESCVQLLDARASQPVATVSEARGVQRLMFARSSPYHLLAAGDNGAYIIDLRKSQRLQFLQQPADVDDPISVQLSDGGRTAFVGYGSGHIVAWDTIRAESTILHAGANSVSAMVYAGDALLFPARTDIFELK